ncbi:MAG: hypothetical protein AB9872_06770 [Solidesulfovibrio sp.]
MIEETEEFVTLQMKSPLIFISHDSRDAEIAEAFSKLLKSVSAGMLQTFRSSDKKGNEGIVFGELWYSTIMSKLSVASDVVCLLTERSLNRPWILYEAGVAKGKSDTPVHGIALGVSLSKAGTGPFYQFQNCDDSEEALSKLVLQLCKRVHGLEPDPEIINRQVQAFKKNIATQLKPFENGLDSTQKYGPTEQTPYTEEESTAKLLEEIKFLIREIPKSINQQTTLQTKQKQLSKLITLPQQQKLLKFVETNFSQTADNGLKLILYTTFLRDHMPWLYDLSMGIYKSIGEDNTSKAYSTLCLLKKAFYPHADLLFEDKNFSLTEDQYALLSATFPEINECINALTCLLEPTPTKDNQDVKGSTPPSSRGSLIDDSKK